MIQELPARKIIWAVTREEHRAGRKSLPDAIYSNLNLFDRRAEGATAVAILRGHPQAEACAKYYKAMGAEVSFFEGPKEKPEKK